MTLNCCKFEFLENFVGFRRQLQLNEWRWTHIVSDGIVNHWMYFSTLCSLRWFAVHFSLGPSYTQCCRALGFLVMSKRGRINSNIFCPVRLSVRLRVYLYVYIQCTSSDLAAGWQQWRSECHGSRRRWCSVSSSVTVWCRWRSLQLPSRAGHSLPDLSATRRLHRVIQVQVGTHLSLQPMYCDQGVRSVPPITQNKYARGIGNYKIQPSVCVLFGVSPATDSAAASS